MKWIKHDTDANQDAKLQNVLLDYGLEGYGLYWYCIELIAGKVDKENITFELEHDARIIARNVGSTPQKVEEMMKYFVEIGLFENTQGVVTCLKLAKRLDKSMTSNPDMRNIIQSLRNHDGVMTQSENIMQDKIRLEENRLDKNNSLEAKASVKQKYPDEFETVWALYPKREGSNPKNKAYSACKARLKEGKTWGELSTGVTKYQRYCQQKGQINTSYVMQASRFFGPELNFENDWMVNNENRKRPTQSAVDRVAAANGFNADFTPVDQTGHIAPMDLLNSDVRS